MFNSGLIGRRANLGRRSLDGWDKIEEKAQQKRLGIWSEGVEKAELSSDFKAKQKAKQKK